VITVLHEEVALQTIAEVTAVKVIGANLSILTLSGIVVELAKLARSIFLLMSTVDAIVLRDGMSLADFRGVAACQNAMLQ
jgi:hypothetical protein